jgi:hypothetical protein
MFQGLSEADRARGDERLRDRAEIIRVDRGQPIFRQGDVANNFFKVRARRTTTCTALDDAAFRMSGQDLLEIVTGRRGRAP